tara:strand:+ start:148 stop:543 length:396 start_codon:yes stop_codon:yes gene_type:complete
MATNINAKNPLTIGIIATLVVMVALAAFGPKISGMAIAYTVVDTPFAVTADYRDGWGECVGQDGDWTDADAYCKSEGFAGAAAVDNNPCLHTWEPTRYDWGDENEDGKLDIPLTQGAARTAGYALTAIKCV